LRKHIIKYSFVLSLFLAASCSTEKNTGSTRTYHNVTARYNIFFNGNESFKKGLNRIEDSYDNDFTRILPLFLYSDESIASSIGPDMERTIQKATKVITLHSITAKPEFKDGPQSQKQKDFYARNEYNNHVPENYFLMGKSYLYRHDLYIALETFKFVLSEYHYDDVVYEAQVWRARTHIMLKEYLEAEDILEVLTGTVEFPEKIRPDLYATLAELYMQQEEYGRAIEPLSRALEGVKKKEERIRYTYILAQLHQEAGDPTKASKYYRDVIKMNPPYEFSFNARINRASVFMAGTDNAKEIKDELRKMLKDDKNSNFRDQIYYAQGNVAFREGNIQEAIDLYKLSSANSTSNTQQKTTTCIKLADIFYERQDYEMADFYYDSAAVYLTNEYPDYEEFIQKTMSLSLLVENLQIVQLEDSLQMLAGLDEASRLAIIDSIIAQLQLAEQRAREEEVRAMQDQQYNRQSLNQSQRTGYTADQGGKWYFYNQAAKGFGQPEFRMKWGTRKLEDNWRRSNKREINFEAVAGEEGVVDSSGVMAEKQKILSNKTREFYLQDIPMTDSMMQISHGRIIESLFNAGTIYKNDLRDIPNSIVTYTDLLNRYPGSDYTLNTYYNLYSIYNQDNNMQLANVYKQSIVREFPESQPAQLLTNPNYAAELRAKENEVNNYYQQTYELFQQGYYDRVIRDVDTALVRYADDPLLPKFELLKVLAIGKTEDLLVFTLALDSLASSSPDEQVADMASMVLAYILNTDQEVKTETQKIEAEEIYSSDTTGVFFYGLFVNNRVDLNQLKFEFINLNIDHFPNYTFDIVDEALEEGEVAFYVKEFPDMENARDYFQMAIMNEAIRKTLEGVNYRPFIISQGNAEILLSDRVSDKYWLFFRKHYSNGEGN
jgi:tetratricopeptide (TPR) repeat protein